jgi:hypothetical protein
MNPDKAKAKILASLPPPNIVECSPTNVHVLPPCMIPGGGISLL